MTPDLLFHRVNRVTGAWRKLCLSRVRQFAFLRNSFLPFRGSPKRQQRILIPPRAPLVRGRHLNGRFIRLAGVGDDVVDLTSRGALRRDPPPSARTEFRNPSSPSDYYSSRAFSHIYLIE
jgi:hypothetical protein